ncbi:MAG TPA: histidine phosphatase family protein [Polyangia bacterium]
MPRARDLYLARHGETAWNHEYRWQGHTDIVLNDQGRQQAAALGESLRSAGIKYVFSSDLRRAHETATIAANVLGVSTVTVDARLRERGFGAFEGLTREECESKFPDIWAAYQSDRRIMPPGSEPHEIVIERMTAGVYAAVEAANADEGGILLVGHGGALRLFLSALFDRPFAQIANGGVLRATVVDGRLHDVADLGVAA